MMKNRVRWLLVSMLCASQLLTGCDGCGDGDKMPKPDASAEDGGAEDSGAPGTPGVQVDAKADLTTTEQGGQATFSVVLRARPTADVTFGLSSSDEGEGTLKVSSLVFTAANWAAPQVVTVTGVDDGEVDGNVKYSVILAPAVSDDDRYDGLDPRDVELTNIDDESAGAIVDAAPNLETSEDGDTAIFTIALTVQPTAPVTISLVSSDPTEGTVAPAALIFTPENWASPQLATVTGVDDDEDDGPQTYNIWTSATSEDPAYSDVDIADVTLVNIDNDSAGFRIEPLIGLRTSEAGDQAVFRVSLNTRPSGNVTLRLTSSDESEVTVMPRVLVFTPNNWRGLQRVIVSGVNDSDRDGNQPFQIITEPAISTDSRFEGLNPDDISGINVDDDSPGVTIRAGVLRTRESGSPQASFTVELNAPPTQNVTVSFATVDTGEVSIQPESLVFTPVDWRAPKRVTLTGVNDDVPDGEKTFTITVTTTSADLGYNGLDIPNITGSNIDDDSPGVYVSPVSGNTRENGHQAHFSVTLNTRPEADVTIAISSSDTSEVTVSTNSLLFTTSDWNSPHEVTLTGVNDDLIDGDQVVVILLSNTVSADAAYNDLVVPDATVINEDDDTPGLRVEPTRDLLTSERSATDTFGVALTTRPTANVRLAVVSSDPSEAVVSTSLLTFTPDNWDSLQEIAVTGQNDDVADGAQPFFIRLGPTESDDPSYFGLTALNVRGTNTDDDSAGITLGEHIGIRTNEGGNPQRSFTVVLNSQPTGQVTIPILSLATSEGTASPATLIFTDSNWSSPQRVYVNGVDDAVADGAQEFAIRVGPSVSGDGAYDGLQVPNVIAVNEDNDSAGITVLPLTRLVVDEGGLQANFTVNLNSQPTAPVTIAVASSDLTEATVSPATLTFTAANWASPQIVRVTGRGDLQQDGDQSFVVRLGPAASTDPRYANRAIPDLPGINLDIDSPAIRVVANNLVTTEAGGQAVFTVALLRQPTADVTLPLASSDLTEGTVSPAQLVFTSANWDAPQEVTIRGVNDDVQDGNQPYFILVGPAMSTDINYGGRVVPNVRVTNNDNDTAGVTLGNTANLTTSETPPGQATFTIRLDSEPTANVTFNLSSNDTTEGTVSPASITFTPVNWNAPRTVTISGVNDFVQDGNATYQIVIGSPVTTDARYAAIVVPSVNVTNIDNDTAGITVTAGTLNTTEAGGTASFSVILTSEPTAEVVIPVASSDLTEGTLSTQALRFTAANWNIAQSVTITGVDDFVQDGPQSYFVTFGAIDSQDANYRALTPPANLAVTNGDNDSAGIRVVSPMGGLTTTEAGVTATFTVELRSQPTEDVRFALVSSDTTEATVAPAGGLTFTAANWNQPQTVTVTGVNDFVADGDQPFAIRIGPADSADANYDTRVVPDVLGINVDNDSPGFVLSRTSITTFEFDTAATFTVRLTSEPTASVLIGLHSTVPSEARVSPASLTFTAANWNVDQTVTVTGVDDNLLDGNKAYVIELEAAQSLPDLVYNGLNPPDVTGTNVEGAYSCIEWLTRHPTFPSGVFPLDTDRTGPNPVVQAYCDQQSDGGGWTLLSWTGDSAVGTQGAPYPGLAYCPAFNCPRGSGVPTGSVNALFDASTEFAQGQTTATTLKPTFGRLDSYEFAGSYEYPSLAALTLDTGAGGCTGVATGTYHSIVNTSASEGVTVYLNSGLRRDDDVDYANFTVDSNDTPYQWSVGNRGGYCTLNGIAPSSFLGTFDDGQYGPAVQAASGSYSVWVR